MREKTVTVKNDAGIHCRPSSEIMSAVQKYPDCSFRLDTTTGAAELSSILSLISLGLSKGNSVTLKVEGPGEEDACEEIAALFEYEFDFPLR
ncbi:MAG: HPr family phosphocarrier protein [Victivallales bacterium]|nr:HPr family phosphocarrier protein [Victivallales bacterium]